MPAPKGGIEALKPAGFGWAITTSDTVDLASETRAIYVGVGGDVIVYLYDPTTEKPTAVTFKNATSGTIIPICTKRVMATGTTATNLVALA